MHQYVDQMKVPQLLDLLSTVSEQVEPTRASAAASGVKTALYPDVRLRIHYICHFYTCEFSTCQHPLFLLELKLENCIKGTLMPTSITILRYVPVCMFFVLYLSVLHLRAKSPHQRLASLYYYRGERT